ncbi:MAG: 50S ribosomal protein L19 [Rickettsiales bacterium]|nr:50S ribosomal protein L19 [Rickettsiales bacterium]
MKNILSDFAKEQVKKTKAIRGADLASFKVGDTVSVKYKITEGGNSRIQAFNGIVIAKTKDASNYAATFTVRKISSGIGVERKFTIYSPLLVSVEVLKQGIVRRAKLYYLRNLTGKASRIKEKLDFFVKSGVVEGDTTNVNS